MRGIIGLAITGVLVLGACGGGGGTSAEACEAAEEYLLAARGIDDMDRTSIDDMQRVSDAATAAKERLIAQAPQRIRAAFEMADSIDSDTLRIEEQERSTDAYAEIGTWFEEDCGLDIGGV